MHQRKTHLIQHSIIYIKKRISTRRKSLYPKTFGMHYTGLIYYLELNTWGREPAKKININIIIKLTMIGESFLLNSYSSL